MVAERARKPIDMPPLAFTGNVLYSNGLGICSGARSLGRPTMLKAGDDRLRVRRRSLAAYSPGPGPLAFCGDGVRAPIVIP